MARGAERRSRGGGTRGAKALALLGVLAATVPAPARAQFFWDQPRGISADDAARSAMASGYRVLARPSRNNDVYVADAVNRRGIRERLIIAADSGEILQRFVLDGPRLRAYADPTIPPGPVPPARVPERDDRHPGFFARLFGNNDDTPPPAALPQPDRAAVMPDEPIRPAPRPRRRPQVVEQTPGVVRPTPVESAPLAPAAAVPALAPKVAPPPGHAPAQASLPPPAAVTPEPAAAPPGATPERSGRSVSTNPLAIPGSREADEKAAAARRDAAKGGDAAPSAAAPVAVAPLE